MRIDHAAGPLDATNADLSGLAITQATLAAMTIDGVFVTDLPRAFPAWLHWCGIWCFCRTPGRKAVARGACSSTG